MIILKIITDLLCGVLNAIGGWEFLPARRFIMPFVLGISTSIVTQVWWTGLLILPVMGALCLGYFSGSNWGRAFWLFLQAVVLGLGLALTGHIVWYFYLVYVIGAGVLGGIYKNWNQLLGDFISGIYLSSIIWLIHA